MSTRHSAVIALCAALAGSACFAMAAQPAEPQLGASAPVPAGRTVHAPAASASAGAEALPPPPGQVRLRWGYLAAPFAAGAPLEEAAPAVPATGGEFSTAEAPRSWRFRIGLPQYILLAGTEDVFVMGTLQSFQLELAENHVITLFGEWGFGDNFLAGGGVGYSYEFEFVPQILRLELRATLGFHHWEGGGYCDYYDDCSHPDGFGVLGLFPTLHVGYEYFFVSIGVPMLVGSGFQGGVTTGFTIRI